MRSATSTSQQKANFLICYLDGVAREKIEELSEQERADYTAIVAHLRKFFEGPQHRYMARQSLSACQQQPGESSATTQRARRSACWKNSWQDFVRTFGTM
ncbi:hypothetical protein Aduo_001183 [Ancylostoma duodenale]